MKICSPSFTLDVVGLKLYTELTDFLRLAFHDAQVLNMNHVYFIGLDKTSSQRLLAILFVRIFFNLYLRFSFQFFSDYFVYFIVSLINTVKSYYENTINLLAAEI